MITIPFSAEPFSLQTTSIEGTDYQLEFRYNQREEVFYLSIYDLESAPIARGIKLLPNFFLRPVLGGRLFFLNPTDTPPNLETLQDAQLYFLTEAEYAAL